FFVGTFGRRIYEVPLNFRSGDGEELPVFETDGWVWGAPKIYDGVLYTADLNGNIYAVDITDGFNELWRVNPGVGGFRASPLVTDDFIIVASRDGIVLWLQRETGAEFTRQDVRNEVLADLLILPGDAEADREPLVIVSTVNNSRVMVAFTLDGAPRWTYPSS
ncbi:MAG: PQQ-binding-like beta-propeller repeat protein, partial [Chloroflexota bacterium]